MKFLAFIALTVSAAAYTTPPGIPQPMWGALDPVNVAQPAQPGAWPSAEAAGYYYIDNTHVSATDTANTYGYPDQPRLTIPETTYAAGAYVEIHGGPYQWTAGDAEFDLDVSGTEADPVWIVGDGAIEGRWEVTGQYCIVDGLAFSYNNGQSKQSSVRFGGDAVSDCSFWCFRNVTLDGEGVELAGSASSTFDFAGSSGDEVNNVVMYNVTATDIGDLVYSQTVVYSDDHAFRPGQYTNNIWFLDCTVARAAGDAIQITGNNAAGAARAQFIYVGDCDFSNTGENAVDVKSSLDVVVSRNTFHNFDGGLGGNGTAVVVQQEGGDGCERVWILFNNISDCYEGIRAEEVVADIYAIGNVVRDVYATGNAAFNARTSGTEITFVNNTVYGLGSGVMGANWDGQGGNAPDLQFYGNIFSGKTDAATYWYEGDATAVARTSDYNIFDTSTQFRVVWEGATYTTLASFQSGESEEANSLHTDPTLTNPGANNFAPLAGSPALALVPEHAAYDAFETAYSLNIRYDITGEARPAMGNWTAGAVQSVQAITSGRVSTLRRAGSFANPAP